MRFFTRCKILYWVFMFFCVCMGIILGLRLLSGTCDFTFVGIFLFLIIYLIMLKCVITDAEEDLTAIMKLVNESETTKDSKGTE